MARERGKMRLWVGFDVGKAFHWVCATDDEGGVLLSRRVEATGGDRRMVEGVGRDAQRIGRRFVRSEARERVRRYLVGLLGSVERKKG